MSKEKPKGNPPASTASLCTHHHPPPLNHSSYLDLQSESCAMILHTTNLSCINPIMPHHLMSQHFRPLPYHNIFYHHYFIIFPHLSHISRRLSFCDTVAIMLPRNNSFIHLLIYACQLCSDNIPPLKSEVLRAHSPVFSAYKNIVDETHPPPITHPPTLHVPK